MTDEPIDNRQAPETRRRRHPAKKRRVSFAGAGQTIAGSAGSVAPEMLEDLFRHSPLPFAAGRLDGNIIAVNQACCDLLGYSDDELRQLDWSRDLTPPEWRDHEATVLAQLLQTKQPVHYEKEFIRRDSSRVPVGLLAYLSRGKDAPHHYFWLSIYDLTERKRAEEALKVSLTKYQVLFESFPLGISISDEVGNIVESNLVAERLLGLPREEQERRRIGSPEWRIVRPDGTPMPPEEFASVRALKDNCLVANVEMGIAKQGGDINWLNVTAAPIPLEGFGVAITYGDVTDRRRAEEELRLQSTALQAAANGIVITDREGNIQWVNDAFTRLTGYSAAEAIGNNPRVLKSGEHDAAFYRDLWDTILSGRVWRGEVVNRRKDGRLYNEEMTITPVRGAGGAITRFIAIKQDITARKRAEAALAEATARVQKLLGSNVIGIAEFDATKIVSANRALLDMTGYSERDVARGRIDWREITPPEYAERDNRAWVEMMTNGECLPYEKEYVAKDGRRVPILIAGVRLTEDPVTGVFLNLDITDWKLMEHELEETTHFAEHLFDSSLIGLTRFREGMLIDANDAFLDIVGYTRDDLKAGLIDIRAMTPPEYTTLDQRAMGEMMAKGEGAPHEKQYIRKDGSRVSVLIGRKLIKESPLEWVAFVLDLTERKQAEADLERMRTEFLGEISHELKTPLTAIKGCASMALSSRTPPDPAEARELFEVVDTQANRLTDLVGNLLDMTRIEADRLSITPEEADLARIIDEARVIFEHSYYPNPLRVVLPSKLLQVKADGRRVVQVLTNLYSNAAKFSPPDMPIVVSAERSGREVIVHVRDGGSGIPSEKMPLLFQKFAQIHTTGVKGTGLGLFICRGIIEAQGGRIWAESAGEGQGSTFSFSLPAVAAATRTAERPRTGKLASGTRRRAKRRVVAIDDEPPILRYVEHCLQNGHYDIASTTEPSAAVALVKSHNPDIVLLDMRLPGTSGLNVLEEIRRFSDVPVAFITATANREDVERGRQFGGTTWLEKPFSQKQLLDHIDRVIAGRRRRRR
jgi:PAS domain S-box-containing protein